jgi:hypothetical protein
MRYRNELVAEARRLSSSHGEMRAQSLATFCHILARGEVFGGSADDYLRAALFHGWHEFRCLQFCSTVSELKFDSEVQAAFDGLSLHTANAERDTWVNERLALYKATHSRDADEVPRSTAHCDRCGMLNSSPHSTGCPNAPRCRACNGVTRFEPSYGARGQLVCAFCGRCCLVCRMPLSTTALTSGDAAERDANGHAKGCQDPRDRVVARPLALDPAKVALGYNCPRCGLGGGPLCSSCRPPS